MSKSKGNVVDPVALIDRYGVDALKYFLLREYTFGQDGVFTNEVMLKRMNYDLANDLGNLVSRTVAMIEKYNDGIVPQVGEAGEYDQQLKEIAMAAAGKVEEQMEQFKFSMALEEIWVLVRRANKYIDETSPWVLAKDEASKSRLDTVLNHLSEAIRIISVLIHPFMNATSKKIRQQMGLWQEEPQWQDASTFAMMGGQQVKKGELIFPRLDIEKELKELEELQQADKEENLPLDLKEEIVYDDFDKLDLRLGIILSFLRLSTSTLYSSFSLLYFSSS